MKNSLPKNPSTSTGPSSSQAKSTASTFTLMSWNVDGLDSANLKTRFTAVCYIISQSVIFIKFYYSYGFFFKVFFKLNSFYCHLNAFLKMLEIFSDH